MEINPIFIETKRTLRPSALLFGLAMMICALLLLGLQAANPAHAATTFTVNSTGDANDLDFPGGTFDRLSDGRCDVDSATTGDQCTLRAAIQQANVTSGADTIAFNIPGSGVQTISPGSELPEIITRVTIDGYTQPDSKKNNQAVGTNAVLNIELNGANVVGEDYGPSISGLTLRGSGASNSVIRGLTINNFSQSSKTSHYGISISSGTGYKIEGNFIGTNPSGTFDESNEMGVMFSNTQSSTLGGTLPEARNLISGNIFYGVQLDGGSSGNKIHGNLIGTTKDGTPGHYKEGLPPIGNGGPGVSLKTSQGSGNRILSNSISSNSGLGIDLWEGEPPNKSGVTENDPKDPDTGPNRLQNYPDITGAQTFGNFTSINGTLDSTPSRKVRRNGKSRIIRETFTIQFFRSPAGEADPSGHGEGNTFLGQIQVRTDLQGNASFSFAPAQKIPKGEYITATATRNRTGDTSEFSNAKVVEEPVIEGG